MEETGFRRRRGPDNGLIFHFHRSRRQQRSGRGPRKGNGEGERVVDEREKGEQVSRSIGYPYAGPYEPRVST